MNKYRTMQSIIFAACYLAALWSLATVVTWTGLLLCIGAATVAIGLPVGLIWIVTSE